MRRLQLWIERVVQGVLSALQPAQPTEISKKLIPVSAGKMKPPLFKHPPLATGIRVRCATCGVEHPLEAVCALCGTPLCRRHRYVCFLPGVGQGVCCSHCRERTRGLGAKKLSP